MISSLLTVVSLSTAVPQGPVVTFTDDTFANNDWQSNVIVIGGAATATAQQVQAGNPAPARRVTHTFGGGQGVTIWVSHLMTAAVYDPSTGSIARVHYSLDAGNVISLQAFNWVLSQGGRLYTANGNVTPNLWATYASGPLDATNFRERLPSGAVVITSHPDFTNAGAPITFGFETGNTAGGTFVAAADYDNFLVNANGAASAAIMRGGTPPNPSVFHPVSGSGPVIGATWGPVIDHSTFLPNATLDFVAFSFSPTNVITPYGTLLCNPILNAYALPAGQSFLFPVPNHSSFIGATMCLQGGSGDPAQGVFLLTNALDATIGTF